MKTKVSIDTTLLNTHKRKRKAELVEQEMEIVINSPYFKPTFLKVLESRNYLIGELSPWKRAEPLEIYEHFMSGMEVLSSIRDYELDIILDDYCSLRRVLGYTKPSVKWIKVNARYFDKNSLKKCGSNVTHEYGHKLGFKHDFRRTERRADSLCYLLNDIYEIVWAIEFKERQL